MRAARGGRGDRRRADDTVTAQGRRAIGAPTGGTAGDDDRSGLVGRLLSRLLPRRLRWRAISVSVDAPTEAMSVGTTVPFTVEFYNPLPLPVTVRTATLRPWTWAVDGAVDASRVPLHDPPDERGRLHFDRGERKRFPVRWDTRFRVDAHTWEPAEPGEYELVVRIDADPDDVPLEARTTLTLTG